MDRDFVVSERLATLIRTFCLPGDAEFNMVKIERVDGTLSGGYFLLNRCEQHDVYDEWQSILS